MPLGQAGTAPPGRRSPAGPVSRVRLALARETLSGGAGDLGLTLPPGALDLFERYGHLIREGSHRLNLTTVLDPVDQAVTHVLDSLSVLTLLPAGPHRLIDVGTGAGFPGVPLAVARPDVEVVLLEATAKKADWLAATVEALGVANATVLPLRAETAAHLSAHRAGYDVAVARAVAPLPALCELCLPLLRPGGRLIAQKSAAGAAAEVPQAARAIATLGATLHGVQPVPLPQLPNRVLVTIEQVRPTPDLYPRRPGIPAKRPL